jgi:hypothetical protein
MIKCSYFDQAVDDAAQGRNQRRLADGPVSAIRNHDGVSSQKFFVLAEKF